MTVEELCEYLRLKGVHDEDCALMKGECIFNALLSQEAFLHADLDVK